MTDGPRAYAAIDDLMQRRIERVLILAKTHGKDPRAVMLQFARFDGTVNDKQLLAYLDAVDPLRQPVSVDRVEAAAYAINEVANKQYNFYYIGKDESFALATAALLAADRGGAVVEWQTIISLVVDRIRAAPAYLAGGTRGEFVNGMNYAIQCVLTMPTPPAWTEKTARGEQTSAAPLNLPEQQPPLTRSFRDTVEARRRADPEFAAALDQEMAAERDRDIPAPTRPDDAVVFTKDMAALIKGLAEAVVGLSPELDLWLSKQMAAAFPAAAAWPPEGCKYPVACVTMKRCYADCAFEQSAPGNGDD